MITLSETAAAEVKRLIASEGSEHEQVLRFSVVGGGCAGFEYQLALEDAWDGEGAELFESHDVGVIVDYMSLPLVTGSTINWSGGLAGKGFTVDNPNMGGGCGCGKSFYPREENEQEETAPCDGCTL